VGPTHPRDRARQLQLRVREQVDPSPARTHEPALEDWLGTLDLDSLDIGRAWPHERSLLPKRRRGRRFRRPGRPLPRPRLSEVPSPTALPRAHRAADRAAVHSRKAPTRARLLRLKAALLRAWAGSAAHAGIVRRKCAGRGPIVRLDRVRMLEKNLARPLLLRWVLGAVRRAGPRETHASRLFEADC